MKVVQTAWTRGTATASLALMVVMVTSLAYAQQGEKKPASAPKPLPPKAEWSGMNCLTSGCHAKLSKMKFVHNPVAQGMCDACHSASDEAAHKFELEEEMPDLCVQCHDAVGQAIAEDSDSKSRHAPAAEGQCGACHNPHSSDIAKLLTAGYPTTQKYAKFSEKTYELCFQCHDADAFKKARVDDETGFRNGAVSLHYMHVAKSPKGRTCALCHEPHAAPHAKLIKKSDFFNKWELRIDYRATDTGGYCGPACHAAKSYDRESPVDWNKPPEPPKAPK